jgi:hypothetical protein
MFFGVQVGSPNGMGMVPMGGMYPPEPQLPPQLPFDTLPDFGPFPSDGFPEQPAPQFSAPSQQTINIDQVLFEFNNARKMLFRFDAYGMVSGITYNVNNFSSFVAF